jgi:hypothetical protein
MLRRTLILAVALVTVGSLGGCASEVREDPNADQGRDGQWIHPGPGPRRGHRTKQHENDVWQEHDRDFWR